MLTLYLCIGGVAVGYGLTWALVLMSRRIINTIEKEDLHDTREITQRLNL